MTNTELRIELLERQIAALRSVLSEYEDDHLQYTQMILANAIADLLLNIKYV